MDTFFASCPKGIEGFLAGEAVDGGLDDVRKSPGGVSFRAEMFAALVFLTRTRTASRVYRLLSEFELRSERDIYPTASGFDWTSLFRVDQPFKITTLFDGAAKRGMGHSMLCSRILKDAVVDRFRKAFGRRPDVETDSPPVAFLQRIEKGPKGRWKSLVYLDLCGKPLSGRGFNRKSVQAPLREDLAAAIAIEMDVRKDGTFYDLMTGSGTVLIETLLKSHDITPSYHKLQGFLSGRDSPFAFLNHAWPDRDLRAKFRAFCTKESQDAARKIEGIREGSFFANDISREALSAFKANMRKARLPLAKVAVSGEDALAYRPPSEVSAGGIVLCHPPYGERLDGRELEGLYSGLGEALKERFKGATLYVLTTPELGKLIRLAPSARVPFKNGPIDCRLFKFPLHG